MSNLRFPVNASSKGHLPIVLYLLTEQNADPLIRNKWGETAYDVAAAVFEVWICEVRPLANLVIHTRISEGSISDFAKC